MSWYDFSGLPGSEEEGASAPVPSKLGFSVWTSLLRSGAGSGRRKPHIPRRGQRAVWPFGCVVILGVCAGTRELAPKRNLLYVYSPTSRAHLWPDVCLTDMSNRRAASREWPAQGHCSQLSHGAPRAAAWKPAVRLFPRSALRAGLYW